MEKKKNIIVPSSTDIQNPRLFQSAKICQIKKCVTERQLNFLETTVLEFLGAMQMIQLVEMYALYFLSNKNIN